jgi:hypothetical protein
MRLSAYFWRSSAVIPSTELSCWQQKMALLFYIKGKKLCDVNWKEDFYGARERKWANKEFAPKAQMLNEENVG